MGIDFETPELPENTAYLVGWFWDLSATRQAGLDLNPINYTEINAWASLHARKLSPFEVKAIRAMDRTFLTELSKRPTE